MEKESDSVLQTCKQKQNQSPVQRRKGPPAPA